MAEIWNLNLINFLTFYLIVMFMLSLFRRIQQYSELGRLVVAGPTRWPRLLKLVKEHRTIFLTWRTVAPLASALGLTILQFIASNWIEPDAAAADTGLTLAGLFKQWYMWPIVLPLACGVLAVDIYFLIAVGSIDRPMLEKYFDQAEYWLASRVAHVVKWMTLGSINPRMMVAEEVRKALIEASGMLNSNLWWVSLQTGLRVCFGLSLWITWALG